MLMLHRILTILVLVWTGFWACGRGAPESAKPRSHAEDANEAVADLQSDSGRAAALIGEWELRSTPPQPLPGLSITVTVDSAFGTRYFGRLTEYFAGNVGQDTGDYEVFGDSIRPNGVVTFSMPTVDHEMLGIVMKGRIATDTIQLDFFVLGPDTISSGPRQWALVRNRRESETSLRGSSARAASRSRQPSVAGGRGPRSPES